MQNPIQQIFDSTGTKPAEFAKRFGFSRQAVDYLVNGVYPTVSDRFYKSLNQLTKEAEYVDEDYKQWRNLARWDNADKYKVQPRHVWDEVVSPFDVYILDTAGNRSRFAREMKVPVRDVSRYARGEALAMPMQLQEAFDSIEFPYKAELIAMQYNWREEYR